MSLSRTPGIFGDERVKREIVRPLLVWDGCASSYVELSVGTSVPSFSIVRGESASDEPYRAQFELSGRSYSCALYTFLPRTLATTTGLQD